MRLAEPFWLLALILLTVPWLLLRRRPRLGWPTLGGFADAPRAFAGLPRLIPPLIKSAAIACVVVALTRPQSVAGRVRVASEGVAIVVVMDRSSTMNTVDFPDESGLISRLEAARRTFSRFVTGRPDDLLGLVAFAMLPDTITPPTLDHGFVLEAAAAVTSSGPLDDGSNIGDALVWGLRDLEGTPPPRKVLVLLSDGLHEAPSGGVLGEPTSPIEAAQMAAELGTTLHTIAIGRPADSSDVATASGPDFALMENLAAIGGGRAFVATDAEALDRAFAEIDRLEASLITGTIRTRYREHFGHWAAAALALLATDRMLAGSRLRRLP